jgi:hypothetical protein
MSLIQDALSRISVELPEALSRIGVRESLVGVPDAIARNISVPESLSNIHVPSSVVPGIAIATGIVALSSIYNRLTKNPRYPNIPGPQNKTQLGSSCFFSYIIVEADTYVLGYLPDLHSETSLRDLHYVMTEEYGHVARLRGGFFGVSVCQINLIHSYSQSYLTASGGCPLYH